MPRLPGTTDAIVIAGANGAGKTTFAHRLLPALCPNAEFLNGDEVQAEASVFAHPVAAGREMLRRLAEAERLRKSFAIETTLSSTMYVRRIRSWRSWGYRVSLHSIELFEQVYKPLVDEWYHWFTSEEGLRLGQHAEK